MSDIDLDDDELFMEELKEDFKKQVSQYLIEMYRLYNIYDSKPIERIEKISHDIKGTSGIFGYDRGTDIARDLNEATKRIRKAMSMCKVFEEEVQNLPPLIEKLAEYLKENDLVVPGFKWEDLKFSSEEEEEEEIYE